MWIIKEITHYFKNAVEFLVAYTNEIKFAVFDVVTSIVSFIWAPSTRGGVAYGVRTLSTNRNSY
jgi:hypothetical protein